MRGGRTWAREITNKPEQQLQVLSRLWMDRGGGGEGGGGRKVERHCGSLADVSYLPAAPRHATSLICQADSVQLLAARRGKKKKKGKWGVYQLPVPYHASCNLVQSWERFLGLAEIRRPTTARHGSG